MLLIYRNFFLFFFKYSWITITFAILSIGILERGLSKLYLEQIKLERQYEELLKQKKQALELQYQLTKQINSQSDPAWLELILKKTLGVVPEGQIKIYFEPSSDQ